MTSVPADPLELQRRVTRIALAGIAAAGFALAGSGAIREHGIISRPTEDVDLFTVDLDVEHFRAAVERVIAALSSSGYHVEESRRAPQFARLRVRLDDDAHVDVDLGVDWRANDPVQLDVGPVLSLPDAIGNKVSALYSRAEPRDYLDVDAIRAFGALTDEELITAAVERDPGFEPVMFARQLEGARRITGRDVAAYGVGVEELEAVKDRCLAWAERLRQAPRPEQPSQ